MIEKTRFIPDGKSERKLDPIVEYKEPKYLYFPTVDLKCPTGETCVIDGQYVKVGELIGTRHGAFFDQPIHSTVSGKVLGIEKKLHGSGDVVDCLIIENDFKYELHPDCEPRTDEEIDELTKEDFIKIIEDSGLAGLGGSGFPTHVKFKTDNPIKYIVANGVECEPYIISDYQIMMSKPERIIQGLVYSMKAMDAPHGLIAVKKKYPELKKSFEDALANMDCQMDIKVVQTNNHYPAGWEIDTIKSATGIKVPVGKLTSEYGVLVANVTTLYGIYRAVKRRMPITERFFSVCGEGIKEPKSFNVRIGTPVRDLIEKCGGYVDDKPKVLVCGGPMMGTNLQSDDFIVSKTTTSLIVFNEQEWIEEACIHCASCVYSCPVDIKPVQIMDAYKVRDKEALEKLDVNRCIECGLCSYTCPSNIHLTEIMRQAKRFLKR
ncbi:MAG: RnfABCDGE type electron transport complex subunit C [Acholeplasmataceae bacterium]